MFMLVKGITKGQKADPTLFIPFQPGAALCCGDDGSKVIVCRNAVSLDITSVTSVDDIRIDGITYSYSAALPTNTAAGRDAIVAETKAILKGLGYVGGAITWINSTGNIWIMHVDYSNLKFEWIGASTNEFVPLDCMIQGHKTSLNVGFGVRVQKLADGSYDVTISAYDGGAGMSAFSITYDGSSITSTVPSTGSYKFNTTALLAEAATALVVSITPTGGSANSRTITEILSRYKG